MIGWVGGGRIGLVLAALLAGGCASTPGATDTSDLVVEPTVDESCRDPVTFVQDIERDAWVLIDGPVVPGEPAAWRDHVEVALPAGAERLERVESTDDAWPEMERSTDLGAVDVVGMTPEVIDAVNASDGPVLLGLTEMVNFGLWRTSTTFAVSGSGELERQLACAEFQRLEAMQYWERARAAGFDGTALAFTVIATQALLVDLSGP